VREGGDFDFPSPLSWTGGVARAFDLAETARSVGAPLLRFFCKGGYDAADIMRFSSLPSTPAIEMTKAFALEAAHPRDDE